METKYYKTIFKSYKDGYYTFAFDNAVTIVFEELRSNLLIKYDLKNDTSLINCMFLLSYSENIADDEEDLIIYKIEYLELITTN